MVQLQKAISTTTILRVLDLSGNTLNSEGARILGKHTMQAYTVPLMSNLTALASRSHVTCEYAHTHAQCTREL